MLEDLVPEILERLGEYLELLREDLEQECSILDYSVRWGRVEQIEELISRIKAEMGE